MTQREKSSPLGEKKRGRPSQSIRAALTNTKTGGDLREQTLLLTVLEAERSKIQVLPGSILMGTHFLIRKTAGSPCVPTWWTGEGLWTKSL